MKHISILVPHGAVLSNIEFPRQVFAEVNEYLIRMRKKPIFDVQLVGVSKSVRLHGNTFTIQPDKTIESLRKTDLIIIPAIYGDMVEYLKKNKNLIEWIKKHHKRGAEVASLCMGAFVLAGTGLLNGKKCATHWAGTNEFRSMFPEVELVTDKIITDEDGLYSSGGGASFLNLIVYLIDKYAGRDVSLYCSKFFQVDSDRTDQSPFVIFQGQKEHKDPTVKKAQEFIERNFKDKITVDQLAQRLATGRRTLERRFKKATSNTLNEYIRRVKIEAVKKQLELTDKKINDIIFEIGYSDYKTFRLSFKSVTGILPHQYRNKYNHRFLKAYS